MSSVSAEMAGVDPYCELGVASDATDSEIRSGFRRAARIHHSDVLGSAARPEARRAADLKFARLKAAHDLLLDPLQRRHLDEALARRPRTDPPPAYSPEPSAGAQSAQPPWSSQPMPPRPTVPAHRVGSVRATLRELDALLRCDARGMAVVAALTLPLLGSFLATHSLPLVLCVWISLLVVQAALAGRMAHTPLVFVARVGMFALLFLADILRSAARPPIPQPGK